METIINITTTPLELAEKLASEIVAMAEKAAMREKHISIALSGGNTQNLLFREIGERHKEKHFWKYVHFFWGDERCVPPDDEESNYGAAKRLLLDKLSIPAENIHRIKGEGNPDLEAERYSGEIMKVTRIYEGFPVFDLILLGLGGDGHTASIFPGDDNLLTTRKICEVATHPSTGQKRITITGRVINNAENIVFLVSGSNKAAVVADIIERQGVVDYPAAFIQPDHGKLKWYLDMNAASMLSQWA